MISSPANTELKPSDNHDAVLTLKPQDVRQTIEGFGASGAWWAQIVGGWPPAKRSEIIDLLYDQSGIALTIYRHNIGAGSGREIRDPWRRAESFEIEPGTYDWTRDKNAMRVLREVCDLGVDRVILFANSPPLRMTKSGYAFASGRSDEKSNLREDMYEAYADYLVDIAEHFTVQEKIPVHGISPINEPQWDWDKNNQEGCHYEPQEAARLLEVLLKKIKQRSLLVKVEAPENGSWEKVQDLQSSRWDKAPIYLKTLMANPNIRKNLDGYAIHSYWADRAQKKAFAEYFFKQYPDLKLHMTEWCEMKRGRDYGMDSALNLAREIMDDLIQGNVSTWQYWIAVSRYNFRDGLIYVEDADQNIIPIKRLWAMGNFSRFIRPGYRRIELNHNSRTCQFLACQSPDRKTIVVVALNPGSKTEKVTLQLACDNTQLKYNAYETSTAHDLKCVQDNLTDDYYTFPPQSITTLVFK